jgi:hypothetical protein
MNLYSEFLARKHRSDLPRNNRVARARLMCIFEELREVYNSGSFSWKETYDIMEEIHDTVSGLLNYLEISILRFESCSSSEEEKCRKYLNELEAIVDSFP